MKPYKRVQISRDKNRFTAIDFIDNLIIDFTEFHGDRKYGDDTAVIGGVGMIKNMPVTVIGIEKGKSTKDKIYRNFGSANPEGYRKALRLMKQAEKFNRPVICFVDTAGAYCGIGAEERGQGMAIAENLMEMMALKTPILSILIGEGGSGGALGLAVSDEVWLMENAWYSVISPEGCASILWKDASKREKAAESLKLTAQDLKELGLIEKVINEDHGKNQKSLYYRLEDLIYEKLREKKGLDIDELLNNRYDRFRHIDKKHIIEKV